MYKLILTTLLFCFITTSSFAYLGAGMGGGAIAATIGLAFAENLFTLFIFYEVLTLSTYPLVAHHKNDEARQAGRTYLGILLGSSIVLFLPAIIATWVFTDTLSFTPGGIMTGKVPHIFGSILLFLYLYIFLLNQVKPRYENLHNDHKTLKHILQLLF